RAWPPQSRVVVFKTTARSPLFGRRGTRVAARAAHTADGGESLEIGRGVAAALGHELVELGLVLGLPQAGEEGLKFPFLFLEATQGLGAVVVERLVPARSRRMPPGAAHLVHVALPTRKSVIVEQVHAPAPDHKCESRKPDRPPRHEADEYECDLGRSAKIVDFCKYGHVQPPPVREC